MNDSSLISIVTATFNSELTIEMTYNSIVSQTYSNWEWVITDDCSTDSTFSLLSELAKKDSRIRLYKNSCNSGAAVSRNNSLSNIYGEFIAFIDSDDIWLSTKLKKQLEFMENNKLDFTFTAYELIDEQGNTLNQKVDTHLKGPINYKDMLHKKATLGCSTVMLRRNAFDDVYMPLLRTGQDYATWLKLLKTGQLAYALSDVFTQYRITPNSISRNKYKKAKRQWSIYREIEKLPILKSLKCFCFYAWRAVFRK